MICKLDKYCSTVSSYIHWQWFFLMTGSTINHFFLQLKFAFPSAKLFCIYCSWNFVTFSVGLVGQLLGIVVRKERPELEEQKDNLVQSIAANKKKLEDCEDEILRSTFFRLFLHCICPRENVLSKYISPNAQWKLCRALLVKVMASILGVRLFCFTLGSNISIVRNWKILLKGKWKISDSW